MCKTWSCFVEKNLVDVIKILNDFSKQAWTDETIIFFCSVSVLEVAKHVLVFNSRKS